MSKEEIFKLAAVVYIQNLVKLLHKLAKINAQSLLNYLSENTDLIRKSSQELFEHLHTKMGEACFIKKG